VTTSTLIVLLEQDDELVSHARDRFPAEQKVVVGLADLKGGLAPERIDALAREHGCEDVAIGALDFDFLAKPVRYKRLLVKCRAKRRSMFDAKGEIWPVSAGRLFFLDYPGLALEVVLGALALARYYALIFFLERKSSRKSPVGPPAGKAMTVAYLRVHFFRAKFGGTLAHTLGVLSGLKDNGYRVKIVSTDPFLGFKGEQNALQAPPSRRFQTFGEIREIAYNFQFLRNYLSAIEERKPDFIYFRNTSFCIAPLLAARRLGVPLVLEFNSSDYWRSKVWKDRRYYFPDLLRRVEILNLRLCDLVVTISDPCKQQILSLAPTAAGKILVNPNAVDPDKFSDSANGRDVRARLGIGDDVKVFGFSGTFMVYHGVPVLAQAIAELKAQGECGAIHFLLIGKGGEKDEIEAFLTEKGASDVATFAGMVPFDEIQNYLAACDVLVAPHNPPPSDTEFFGSPIKIFEYMAMGRAIIASRVGQVAGILTDGEDALLTPPGDVAALRKAIIRLRDDEGLRAVLGRNARRRVLESYTWKQNVKKVVDALVSMRDT